MRLRQNHKHCGGKTHLSHELWQKKDANPLWLWHASKSKVLIWQAGRVRFVINLGSRFTRSVQCWDTDQHLYQRRTEDQRPACPTHPSLKRGGSLRAEPSSEAKPTCLYLVLARKRMNATGRDTEAKRWDQVRNTNLARGGGKASSKGPMRAAEHSALVKSPAATALKIPVSAVGIGSFCSRRV